MPIQLRHLLCAASLAASIASAPLLLEAGVAATGGAQAHAQSAQQTAKADSLLTLIYESGMVRQTLEALNPVLLAQVEATASEQGLRLDEAARKRVVEIATQETLWMYEDMRPQLAGLYATTFTTAELDTLIELYSSPTGRSIMEKLPALTGGMAQILTTRIPDVEGRVQRRIQSEVYPTLR